MSNINSQNLKLREKRINIENGIKDSLIPQKVNDLESEATMIRRKKEFYEKINGKNVSKLKVKMTEKEKRMMEVEEEIIELRKALKKRESENEKLSGEVKNLK